MDIVWNVPLTINIGGIDIFSLTHHSCSCPNIIKPEPIWQILSYIFLRTLDLYFGPKQPLQFDIY